MRTPAFLRASAPGAQPRAFPRASALPRAVRAASAHLLSQWSRRIRRGATCSLALPPAASPASGESSLPPPHASRRRFARLRGPAVDWPSIGRHTVYGNGAARTLARGWVHALSLVCLEALLACSAAGVLPGGHLTQQAAALVRATSLGFYGSGALGGRRRRFVRSTSTGASGRSPASFAPPLSRLPLAIRSVVPLRAVGQAVLLQRGPRARLHGHHRLRHLPDCSLDRPAVGRHRGVRRPVGGHRRAVLGGAAAGKAAPVAGAPARIPLFPRSSLHRISLSSTPQFARLTRRNLVLAQITLLSVVEAFALPDWRCTAAVWASRWIAFLWYVTFARHDAERTSGLTVPNVWGEHDTFHAMCSVTAALQIAGTVLG